VIVVTSEVHMLIISEYGVIGNMSARSRVNETEDLKIIILMLTVRLTTGSSSRKAMAGNYYKQSGRLTYQRPSKD
jgi:hypothetical protein